MAIPDIPPSGDLASINVLEDGSGEVTTTTDKGTLDQIDGKSIIIHADADNFPQHPHPVCGQAR